MKQKVALLEDIILIPSKPIFALVHWLMEKQKYQCIVFGLEPTIYHTRGEHTNHYTTDVVCRDRMVVGFTTTVPVKSVPITTSVHGEAFSIQHYVIKFVTDLRQVSGFLRVLRFPPPIKMTATI